MGEAERTRERLRRQAVGLFDERGFDDVTVEEVARAAGVSHMTFYRHFPTKESVVLDDPYDPLIGEAVARQDAGRPPVQRVLAGLVEAWGSLELPDEESLRTRLRLAAGHPSLRARVWENNRQTEEVIVDVLTGTGVSRLDARVAAGAVMGALTAALLDWAQSEQGAGLGERIVHTARVLGVEADRETR